MDGKHSMIRYYINNFTDGYNNDCLDLSQGQITAQQKLNSRSLLSPIKLAFMMVFGAVIATSFILNSIFPYPGEGQLAEADMETAKTKVWLLHRMIQIGVFLVGVLGIVHNGRNFVDDASRLNL